MPPRNRRNGRARRQGLRDNPLPFLKAPRAPRATILRRRHLVSTCSMVDT
jgi:hypothetical protein